MTGLSLSVPAKRDSVWLAETDPKYARVWLGTLPLADSAEAAREIYQALYTLNRQTLDATQRFELMELYGSPVALVTTALESYYVRAPLPLSPKKRQLAEFIRQLHMEMAYGYKACLQDTEQQRLRWGKKSLRAHALERALYYLGEVLLHSCQVYMPYPPEVWRELHAIYRYGTEHHLATEVVQMAEPLGKKTTLELDYIRVLLLGLSSPYQLPQNEYRQVQRFLYHWGAKAVIRDKLDAPHPAGHFLIDPAADAPPGLFPRDGLTEPNPAMRLLDAVELLSTIQFFIQRLEKGESAQTLSIGLDSLDTACLEVLQRMQRSWGLVPRRRHSRIQRSSPVFVCAGIPALHFFASGQKPFTAPVTNVSGSMADDRFILAAHIEEDISRETKQDEEFIALDEPAGNAALSPATDVVMTSNIIFRVDHWQIKDVAPKGLQLVRQSNARTTVRVGDLVGIQQMEDVGRWSVGMVRWMKSPQTDQLEMGAELLAPDVLPVTVAPARRTGEQDYQSALLLPAVDAVHRPVTLLLPRGVFMPDADLMLMQEGSAPRTVRLLKRLEHSNIFESFVFADVLT